MANLVSPHFTEDISEFTARMKKAAQLVLSLFAVLASLLGPAFAHSKHILKFMKALIIVT